MWGKRKIFTKCVIEDFERGIKAKAIFSYIFYLPKLKKKSNPYSRSSVKSNQYKGKKIDILPNQNKTA